MENTVADIGQTAATGIFLRFPIPFTHVRNGSYMITLAGESSRSSSRSTGPSIFVSVASTKLGWSAARTSSDGMTLGIVPNWILAGGLVSELRKPSHSSVTIKVMRKSGRLAARSLQRFIIGLMWPRPGNGRATTWQVMAGFKSADPIWSELKLWGTGMMEVIEEIKAEELGNVRKKLPVETRRYFYGKRRNNWKPAL